MQRQSTKPRALLRGRTFLHMPSVYDPLGAHLVQSSRPTSRNAFPFR